MTIQPRVRDLLAISDAMFADKAFMLSLWDEIAGQFYPERQDFTTIRETQAEWADHLSDSFPIFARRELGDAVSSMLRPRGKPWASLKMRRDALNEIPAVKTWLSEKTKVLMRMLYDPAAKFVRATKMADHDYVTFGNAVISVEDVPDRSQLLFQTWHIRDCAWAESHLGDIDRVDRKTKMTLRAIKQKWPKTFPDDLSERLRTNPNDRLEVRHVVCPREDFERIDRDGDAKRAKAPFVEVYVLPETQTVLSENDLKLNPYVIPRWHLTGATPYAYSPAAMVALPDARQAQALALMFREAGEKMLDPPLVAVKEALRSDLSLMSGTVTWIDAEYDERSGEAVRPLQDIGDMPTGMNMREELRGALSQAWMLNKLSLPQNADMTAYETARRMEEYVRAVVPLFEPLEHEYNAPLLDKATQIAIAAGAFGNPEDWPDEVKGEDFEFSFENAIQAAMRERAAAAFTNGLQLRAAAQQIDQQAGAEMDIGKGLTAALEGVGWDWNRDEADADEAREEVSEMQGIMQAMALAREGGAAAKDIGGAVKEFSAADSAMEQAA